MPAVFQENYMDRIVGIHFPPGKPIIRVVNIHATVRRAAQTLGGWHYWISLVSIANGIRTILNTVEIDFTEFEFAPVTKSLVASNVVLTGGTLIRLDEVTNHPFDTEPADSWIYTASMQQVRPPGRTLTGSFNSPFQNLSVAASFALIAHPVVPNFDLNLLSIGDSSEIAWPAPP